MDALEKSDTYDGELVREAVRKARGEQDALRKKLFPDTTARCELCGRDLPTELLVAAHIKKRQHCTDNERRSMEVVMAACRLGCDELYERGLITVADDGSISISPQVASWTSVEDYVKERLANRTVANWHEGQRPVFYRWHRTHTFRGGVDL
jgi:predicted restriction endonuclease